MTTTHPAQNDLVRRTNRLNVFRLLLQHAELTRADLATGTGLSVPTVTTIVGEFGDLGLVTNRDSRPRGGRPAQLVRLEASARSVLSLNLSGREVRSAVADLRGELRSLPPGPALGKGCENVLMGWLEHTLQTLPGEHVARLAVAVPGAVDGQNGHVHLAPALGWSDYALAEVLGRFGLGVVLENDVNALALAERTRHEAASFQDVLFVHLGRGVGASVFVGGRLYRGAGAAAGEIGYSRLPGLGGELRLGEPGPLEAHLLELTASFTGPDGKLVLETAEAERAFVDFADTFGLVLHNLVCLLNPQKVIVSWPVDPGARLVQVLRSSWRGPLEVTFHPSYPDEHAALRGVAQVALEGLALELCASPEKLVPGKRASEKLATDNLVTTKLIERPS